MDIFENSSSPRGEIMAEAHDGWKTLGVKLDEGIKMYIEGAEFPHKGLPTAEAIWAVNLVKKTIFEVVKVLVSVQFWPSLVLVVVLPKGKFIQRVVDSFNRLSWGALSPYIIKDEYLTACAQEIKAVVGKFGLLMGLSEGSSAIFSKICAHVVEYDTAYRFRLQDLLSETTKERLIKNPRGEVKRLSGINKDRELGEWGRLRVDKLCIIVGLLLLSPKIKWAFREVMKGCNLAKLQFDESDRYWCTYRQDYNYSGLTYDERQKWLKNKGYRVPTLEKL